MYTESQKNFYFYNNNLKYLKSLYYPDVKENTENLNVR